MSLLRLFVDPKSFHFIRAECLTEEEAKTLPGGSLLVLDCGPFETPEKRDKAHQEVLKAVNTDNTFQPENLAVIVKTAPHKIHIPDIQTMIAWTKFTGL